jgi:hypothetical protein
MRLIVDLAFVFVIGLATFLGLRALPEPQWATLSDLHAGWNQDTETISLHLVGDKRRTCQATPIAKFLTPMSGEDLLSRRIPVNGNLAKKLQALPVGRFSVFDTAKPRTTVTPGEYVLSLTVSCELSPEPSAVSRAANIPSSPQLLASNELTIRVVVP